MVRIQRRCATAPIVWSVESCW